MGLEQTKYFTQGCDNLVVVTDHKPLTKIFGNRNVDEINNTWLFRLKQRTLTWRFDIAHLPGSTSTASDAALRHPATSEFFATISGDECDTIDSLEEALLASVRQNTRDELTLNWDEIARHTASDAALNDLLSAIQSNFDVNFPPEGGIRQYLPYRDGFYISDDVILYNDRVVISPQLRYQVLCTLHAAHQGVSAMERRARATVFWPGMTQDIHNIRDQCFFKVWLEEPLSNFEKPLIFFLLFLSILSFVYTIVEADFERPLDNFERPFRFLKTP